MDKKYIIANWKANKTVTEAKEWLQKISSFKFQVSNFQNKEVIVCPPYTLLSLIKDFITVNNFPLKVGAQSVSAFDPGAHTGEIPANLLKEFVEYVIIGHSERRQEEGESDEILAQKVIQAQKEGLKVIFCIQGKETSIPQGVTVAAYEPIFAIGSGTPDTPKHALEITQAVKRKYPQLPILYGGSVTAENVHDFTSNDTIAGVLVGGASLDADKFAGIIQSV